MKEYILELKNYNRGKSMCELRFYYELLMVEQNVVRKSSIFIKKINK